MVAAQTLTLPLLRMGGPSRQPFKGTVAPHNGRGSGFVSGSKLCQIFVILSPLVSAASGNRKTTVTGWLASNGCGSYSPNAPQLVPSSAMQTSEVSSAGFPGFPGCRTPSRIVVASPMSEAFLGMNKMQTNVDTVLVTASSA